MPLVAETTDFRHLRKEITQADYGAITSTHMYDKQVGSDGVDNRTFTLPKDYAVGSDTLMIFINGQKAELNEAGTYPNQYREANSRTVVFGAALASTDVVEFFVAGTWNPSGSAGGGSGSLNAVIVDSNYTMVALDRAVCIAESAITVNLPASPIQGDVCEVIDALGQANVNEITVGRNGNPIQGETENLVIDTAGDSVFFIYVDATYGWKFMLTGNNIEQVTGFRQYHSVIATEDQTVFNLPFSVDEVTKNVSVHADGLQMQQDIAYTITAPTQITFTEGFFGGESVIFESFLASSLGQLYSLEEAKLFKQTHEEVATAGQDEVTIPFTVDLARKNLSVHVDGVRQYVDDAFVLTSSQLLTFSETFDGGEKILVESFNVGSLDDLTFNSYQYEATATANQQIITLPFEYEVGAKNLAVTINGVRQSPSKFTEVDTTTIMLISPMDKDDEILVESVPMGAFGAIPLAQDSNALGGIAAEYYLTLITEDMSIYLSPTGSDDTGDGSEGTPWVTWDKVMDFLKDKRIFYTATVTVYLMDGIHTPTGAYRNYHVDCDRILLKGVNSYEVSITSINSTSGSSGAYSLVLNVSDASNAAVGNYCIIRNSTTEDPSAPSGSYANPEYICGVHEITAVDTTNSRITVLTTGAKCPSGTVTADMVILPAIIQAGSFSTIYKNTPGLFTATDFVVLGPGKAVGGIGVQADNNSVISCSNVGIKAFDEAFYAVDGGVVDAGRCVVQDCSHAGYAVNGGEVKMDYGVGVGCVHAFIANYHALINCDYAWAIAPDGDGFYSLRVSHIEATGSRVLDAGSRGYDVAYLANINAGTSKAIGCSSAGYFSRYAGHIHASNTAAENCGTGFYAAFSASIYRAGHTVYGNTTDFSPAWDTEGNDNSYIS